MVKEDIRAILEELKSEQLEEGDILINLLHKIQAKNHNNYVSPEDAELVAEELKIPVSKVYEVLTFYSMFSTKPRGKHVIRICTSLPCHVAGGREIVEFIKQYLKVDFGQTTSDGLFTLEHSGCLGLCGVSPVIMIDDQYYGDLTVEKVKEILDSFKGGDVK